mmetsp:Transcript_23533/g.49693  ORF Transcript_23533/g.49693 Transcript_23533/m.49693 type:complete len:270 (+) Transcript_23533:479-1288(+)
MGNGLDDGPGPRLGIRRFENPTSHEHSVHTQLHHERRIRRGGHTPGRKVHHGKPSVIGNVLDEFVRSLKILRRHEKLILGHALKALDLRLHGSGVTHSLDDISRPGLSLGAEHGRPLGDSSEGLADVATSAHEGHVELIFIDVVDLIGHGEDFRLVDVVDFAGLENLGFDEVSDAGFGHDGDGDGVFDFEDHGRVGHAGDSSVAADVGGDAFEGHDGDGSGGFGDFGLFYVHDVHNYSSLEHLSQSLLDLGCTGLGTVLPVASVGSCHG